MTDVIAGQCIDVKAFLAPRRRIQNRSAALRHRLHCQLRRHRPV